VEVLFHDFLLAAIVTAFFAKVCMIINDDKLLFQKENDA
jgi:hypothetical protein